METKPESDRRRAFAARPIARDPRARILMASVGWLGLFICGCATGNAVDTGPAHDRPFPLGATSDALWETQQTNAEAADFIFYDHEFVGESAELAPAAKQHLEQIALRLEHVPFPIVIEQTDSEANRRLDLARRKAIVGHLARMGLPNAGPRVVVAPAFPEGITAIEAQNSYRSIISNGSQNFGRRFGGAGGAYR